MNKRWLVTLVAMLCAFVPRAHAQETEFPRDLHGLWWEPSDPGWAIAMFDHQVAMSSAHLVYDTEGMPTWVVTPRLDCFRDQPPFLGITCGGALYRVTGSWFGASSFRAADVVIDQVGEWEGNFSVPLYGGNGPDLRRALSFSYSIDGQPFGANGLRSMQIQVIDPDGPLLWRDGRYSGLWSNPDEPGWGVGVFVQNNTLFATLLVHGPDRQPRWYVVSANAPEFDDRPDRIFEGLVYETRGYPRGSGLFGASELLLVGRASLHFGAEVNDPASLRYSINGVQVSRTIVRPD